MDIPYLSNEKHLKALHSLLEMVPPYQLRYTVQKIFFHGLLSEEAAPLTCDQIRDVQLLIQFLDELERVG